MVHSPGSLDPLLLSGTGRERGKGHPLLQLSLCTRPDSASGSGRGLDLSPFSSHWPLLQQGASMNRHQACSFWNPHGTPS